MWIKLIDWFSGTLFGKYAIGIISAGIAILSIYLRGRHAGRKSAKDEQDRIGMENAKNRMKIDEKIAKNSGADNRRALSKWLSGQ